MFPESRAAVQRGGRNPATLDGSWDCMGRGSTESRGLMDGMLAALAGVWMLAEKGDAPERLDDVARQVAVTNFFKHSLRTRTKSGRQGDLNPKNIDDRSQRDRFVRVTREHYVDTEVAALQPGVVIGFTTVKDMGGFAGFPVEVRVVNDPSWVKQGMAGVASKGGSWKTRVERSGSAVSSVAGSRISSWVQQLGPSYSKGKQEAMSIYLTCYFLDFC